MIRKPARKASGERRTMIRVVLPDGLLRRCRAHGELHGSRGAQLAIEQALERFFAPERRKAPAA